MLPIRLVMTVLCAIGFYASVFMLRKSLLAQRGALAEPSIVQTPNAKLVAGIPNALLGVLYYVALPAVVWTTRWHAALIVVQAAALMAAGMSLGLAYSLLFVSRRGCAYCWTAHGVNWALAATVPWLLHG